MMDWWDPTEKDIPDAPPPRDCWQPDVRPITICPRWFRTFNRNTGNCDLDYDYEATWPDGSITHHWTIPNDWDITPYA